MCRAGALKACLQFPGKLGNKRIDKHASRIGLQAYNIYTARCHAAPAQLWVFIAGIGIAGRENRNAPGIPARPVLNHGSIIHIIKNNRWVLFSQAKPAGYPGCGNRCRQGDPPLRLHGLLPEKSPAARPLNHQHIFCVKGDPLMNCVIPLITQLSSTHFAGRTFSRVPSFGSS